ncbi:MAG: hypothetical protein H7841_16710 [Magnetospirillum sp. WYHS-4]
MTAAAMAIAARRPHPNCLHATAASEGTPMPKKPNYRFERFERERQKAEKKAERLAAKQDKAGVAKPEDGSAPPPPTETPEE